MANVIGGFRRGNTAARYSVLRPSTDRPTRKSTCDDRGRPSPPTSSAHYNQCTHSLYLFKKKKKERHDCHNIAPWSTAHARTASPPSFFYLDLIILFVIIADVGVNVSSSEKSSRCTRNPLCCPRARRYIRTERIRSIWSAILRSSWLSVHSPIPSSP